jgi:hypothetical protein
VNNKKFEHTCHYGTRFTSETCDFRNGVIVERSTYLDEVGFVTDIAEMVGFHATNILPELNGFQGYDAIRYTVVAVK